MQVSHYMGGFALLSVPSVKTVSVWNTALNIQAGWRSRLLQPSSQSLQSTRHYCSRGSKTCALTPGRRSTSYAH